jgi:hypothetical protein
MPVFDGAIAQPAPVSQTYELRLYVAGQTPKSVLALANLRQICETHLHGRYEIEVIDLMENPQLAQGDQILAVPTPYDACPNRSGRSSAISNTNACCRVDSVWQ